MTGDDAMRPEIEGTLVEWADTKTRLKGLFEEWSRDARKRTPEQSKALFQRIKDEDSKKDKLLDDLYRMVLAERENGGA